MIKKRITTLFLLSTIIMGQEKGGLSPVLRSLILPGWGEYSLDKPKRGRTFVISETVLWTSFAGAIITGNNIQQLFEAYASNYADVKVGGKDRQFWVDVGNYSSRDAHNEEHLRFREFEALYPQNETWDWKWSSDTKRKNYRKYRVAADQWKLTATFIAGGIVINHVISAIDALYLQRIAHVDGLTVLPVYNYPLAHTGISLNIYF